MSHDADVVLITGCSTGFGKELAEAALSSGLRVIATARRPESMTSLSEKGAKTMKLDVTASPEELRQFASDAISIFGRVDYLINNAGFLQGGAVEENSHEENLAQLNTNFFGVINLTNAFLPDWRARKSGTIVNISSQGSMICVAGAGIYCAGKAALDAISDTWARELASFNIRCVSIQPGSFRTAVAESANTKIAAKKIEGYDSAHEWIDGFNKASGTQPGDPAVAAKKIIELISKKGELPMRLPIGDDAYENAKAFYEGRLKEIEAWKGYSTGMGFVDK
ncbi:short-chain oxidoreductase [Favolaschia claudopus]|uniref:Short-chain oxidoreductase n=1 Tax=Favolaschia claudopus TaxID=2862362 RepID=A0AAW0AX21_9AGAR